MSFKTISVMVLFAGAVVLGGCAPQKREPLPLPDKLSSQGAHKDKFAAVMKSEMAELKAGREQLDASVKALNAMIQPSDEDIRARYQKFSKAVDDLTAQTEKIKKVGDEVRLQGNAFYTAWEKELPTISNLDIRSASESRRKELSEEFLKIDEHFKEIGKDFDPLHKVLKDIKVLLSNDLSPSGLENLKKSNLVQQATETAGKVGQDIDKGLVMTQEMVNQVAPPPPEPEKAVEKAVEKASESS